MKRTWIIIGDDMLARGVLVPLLVKPYGIGTFLPKDEKNQDSTELPVLFLTSVSHCLGMTCVTSAMLEICSLGQML